WSSTTPRQKNAHILRYGHFRSGCTAAKRSAQRREHLGCDLFHRPDTFDTAVLRRAFGGSQALIEIHQRLGLRVIDGQAMTHGLFLVVVALDQLLASFVVLAGNLRRVVFGVVDPT